MNNPILIVKFDSEYWTEEDFKSECKALKTKLYDYHVLGFLQNGLSNGETISFEYPKNYQPSIPSPKVDVKEIIKSLNSIPKGPEAILKKESEPLIHTV